MSHHQKDTYVSIICLIAFLIGYFIVAQPFGGGDMIEPRTFGRDMLKMIAGTILIGIISHVLLAIMDQARNSKTSELVDERDRMIETKSFRVYKLVAGIVFMIAIFGMAFFGAGFVAAFHIVAIGLAVGDLLGNFYRLALYQWGSC